MSANEARDKYIKDGQREFSRARADDTHLFAVLTTKLEREYDQAVREETTPMSPHALVAVFLKFYPQWKN